MGMRIGGSSAAGAAQGASASNWQQRQQGVKDLMAALQAGDLGSAQQAFSRLPGAARQAAADNGGASGKDAGNSPLAQIGKALQAGDLAGAQQAAQAWQAARSGHHRHHAEGPAVAQANTPVISTTPGSTSVVASGSTGTIVNLTA